MTAFQIPVLRYVFRGAAPFWRTPQKRWAQVHDIRFVATHRKADDVFDMYREKLARKAKEEGLSDVNELKAVYHEKIEKQRKQAIETARPSPASSPLFPQPPQASAGTISPDTKPLSTKSTIHPGMKTLSSYIDVEKTRELPEKEIEYIWRLRHAHDQQSLCAVIPNPTYSRILKTARSHPQFILPLPREGQGAEMHFLEWTFPTATTVTVLFTHFAEYRLRGEYSQPHTIVTHHTDLADSKGLVLLQGNVVGGRGITVDEGKWLLMCLQKFYGGADGIAIRKKLLEQFTRGDLSFEINELLQESEKII